MSLLILSDQQHVLEQLQSGIIESASHLGSKNFSAHRSGVNDSLLLSVEKCLPKRFEVTRRLGSSASADTYCVVDREGKRKPWAVKIFKAHPAVQQDGDTLVIPGPPEMRCRGEHVANVVAFGPLDANAGPGWLRFWLARELCDSSLKALLQDREPLSWSQAVDFVRQILRGLQSIHQQGLVHRNIKLENVLVNDVEGKPVLKFSDFGLDIATWMPPSAPELAPELCDLASTDGGSWSRYSKESDVFALGIVLLQMLSRKLDDFRLTDPALLRNVQDRFGVGLAAMIAAMTQTVASKRPTVAACLAEFERFQQKLPLESERICSAKLEHDAGLDIERRQGWRDALPFYLKARANGSDDAAVKVVRALAFGMNATIIDEVSARNILKRLAASHLPGASAIIPTDIERLREALAVLPGDALVYACLRLHRERQVKEDKHGSVVATKHEPQDDYMREKLRDLGNAGDALAQWYLALSCQQQGQVLEMVKWLAKAAEQGHCPSQLLLAQCYRKGIGVAVSPNLSAAWFAAAWKQGAASVLADSVCELQWQAEYRKFLDVFPKLEAAKLPLQTPPSSVATGFHSACVRIAAGLAFGAIDDDTIYSFHDGYSDVVRVESRLHEAQKLLHLLHHRHAARVSRELSEKSRALADKIAARLGTSSPFCVVKCLWQRLRTAASNETSRGEVSRSESSASSSSSCMFDWCRRCLTLVVAGCNCLFCS